MSGTIGKVRDIALLLPGVTEDGDGAAQVFSVEGTPFVRVEREALSVRDVDWRDVPVGPDADWTRIEDRIARSWELAAPRALLEAGGR